MKALGIWLVLATALFGGTAAGYHVFLEDNPRRVMVVVDTSFPMRGREADIGRALEHVQASAYSTFALRTEKAQVHGWADALAPSRLAPFGPRDFTALETAAAGADFDEADRVVLITNAPPAERSSLPGSWEIVELR